MDKGMMARRWIFPSLCVVLLVLLVWYITSVPTSDTAPLRRQLSIHTAGRMGNHMFQYASLLGIAKRSHMTPILMDGFNELSQVFHLGAPYDKLGSFWDKEYKTFEETYSNEYDIHTERLGGSHTLLKGYYQSWKYFSDVVEDLRYEFRFRDEILYTAKGFHQAKVDAKLGQTDLIKVGVHVRRGDVTLPEAYAKGYTTANELYLLRAMEYFRQLYKNVGFVVASDDIRWCKEKLQGDDVVFSEGLSSAVDLSVLSLCNHTVMTTGTFGWWASYLAGGTVIYYKNWPRHKSPLEAYVKKEDYFLPDWIPME